MSQIELSDLEGSEKPKATCRIPQLATVTSPGRQKSTLGRPRAPELLKAKFDVIPPQQLRYGVKNLMRLRPDESHMKSGRGKLEVMAPGKTAQTVSRLTRSDREKLLPAPKRPSVIPKRVINNNTGSDKLGKPVITVPVQQKQLTKSIHTTRNMFMPDQETIQKHEEMEVKQGVIRNKHDGSEFIEGESLSANDKITSLKYAWQEKLVLFETMKNELSARQKNIADHYIVLKSMYQKLVSAGQNITIPNSDDLYMMNVAKLSPEQLLQLCAQTIRPDGKQSDLLSRGLLSIDLNKVHDMPSKLISTCEQALSKRKEVIDWFETLKTQEKGISLQKLDRKINEFKEENEALNGSLENVKADFNKDLSDVVEILRQSINEKKAFQFRIDELMLKLAEVNSPNNELKKQNNTAVEQSKPMTMRHKVEELERELKEEKSKKVAIKDRLNRIEGEVKIRTEKISSIEAELQTAHSQIWNLERTVQQLQDQNQNLQLDYGKEVRKLTDSIQENILHLEEIAKSREMLQNEKDDLEKRLYELSHTYNESVKMMKEEINNNVAKVIATEKRVNDEKEVTQKLEGKVESLCAQLLTSELRYKETLLEKEELMRQNSQLKLHLEKTNHDLKIGNLEVENYKSRLIEKSEAIKEIERDFQKSIEVGDNLQQQLKDKECHVAELIDRQTNLEEKLQESENKMKSYQDQLFTLKDNVSQLQQEFGEFENINDINEILNQQKYKLIDLAHQNNELAETLQKKSADEDRHLEFIKEQEVILEQKDKLIKRLSEKEEEHLNVIKLLRNNLEMRTQADTDLNQQITEKNIEIESLITTLETRKLQITQLEKIILTLEDQTRKASIQRNKDQDKIGYLEHKISELESRHNTPDIETVDNLDNLMKILEKELGTPVERNIDNDSRYNNPKCISGKIAYDKKENAVGCRTQKMCYVENEAGLPTKMLLGNKIARNKYSSDDQGQNKKDHLDRKRAITNIDGQGLDVQPTSHCSKDNCFTKGGIYAKDYLMSRKYILQNQLRDEKRCKMYNLAGHRL